MVFRHPLHHLLASTNFSALKQNIVLSAKVEVTRICIDLLSLRDLKLII